MPVPGALAALALHASLSALFCLANCQSVLCCRTVVMTLKLLSNDKGGGLQ